MLEIAREGPIPETPTAPHREVPTPHRQIARAMRADATKAETMLWNALSGSKLDGMKLKRREPIDGYILDFVCFQARLIIEVGGKHAESERDLERGRYFANQGFRTVRFWNDEVERNLDAVCV